eukprot:scaffold765_cov151-Chaetoceros_neogracile.AAC.15
MSPWSEEKRRYYEEATVKTSKIGNTIFVSLQKQMPVILWKTYNKLFERWNVLSNSCDLEGPTLPGLVNKASRKETDGAHPIIFAIGGIESENCHHPAGYGSDGVAVIRSVMQASDPALAVKFMKEGMKTSIRSSMKHMQQD